MEGLMAAITTKDKKFPVAKVHKFLHAAPQFRPIRRGARRKGIERQYESKDGNQHLTIKLFYELDIADQDLLLCLVSIAMAIEKSTVVSSTPKQEVNIVLREKLKLDGEAVTQMPAVSARTTAYEILNELGRATGKPSYEWLEKSLDRLAGVSFKYKSKRSIDSFHLISWNAKLDEKGVMNGIGFCINPYSAMAILGEGGGYVLLHRDERAQLSSDEAKALHSVLCGLVDMGTEHSFKLDMLADKVYSRYDEEISDDVIRCRRKSIFAAIKEINNLEYWSCATLGIGIKSILKVSRKRRAEVSL